VKGKNYAVVDALSRMLPTLSLMDISEDWKSLLLVEYSKNKFSCEVLDGQVTDDKYRVVDDFIYYKDRIYLVLGSYIRQKIMQATHDSPLAGHQGFLKTYRQVQERFTWKNLKGYILKHVQECRVCQQNKVEHTHLTGLLQPLPIPD
jgi:hypothetical protein